MEADYRGRVLKSGPVRFALVASTTVDEHDYGSLKASIKADKERQRERGDEFNHCSWRVLASNTDTQTKTTKLSTAKYIYFHTTRHIHINICGEFFRGALLFLLLLAWLSCWCLSQKLPQPTVDWSRAQPDYSCEATHLRVDFRAAIYLPIAQR